MRHFFIRFTSSRAVLVALMLTVFSGALLTGCRSGSAEVQYLDRGKELLAKKEYARAILEFKNATRLQPKDAEPYYQTGLVYLAMGDYQSGYQLLRKAAEVDPKHVKAQEKIAEIIADNVSNTKDPQQLQAAETQVRSVLARVPDSSKALSALGLTEYSMGKSEQAAKDLETALEKAPQNLTAASGLALINMKNKNFHNAEEILKKAAADSPQSADAQLALGRFYVSMRRNSDAETAFRKALTIDPKFGPALLALASIQFVSDRKKEAETTLAALSALPDKQYRLFHADYLFQQGNVDEAIKELEQQAAADPKDRDVFTRLTSAYFAAKKFPEAERAIKAALKRNPKDVNALLDRSKLYLATAKTSEAETDLNQVLQFDPNSAIAHYLLSKVFATRGQQLAARQQLSKALDYNPTLLDARLELAQSLTAEGGAKSALELLDQTPEDQKNLLPVIVARNWAFFGAKDPVELRKSLDNGLKLYTQAPDLVYQDGLLKFQAKDITGARRAFEQVLSARPEDAVALDSLAKTYAFEKRSDLAQRTVVQYAVQRPNSAPLQNLLGDWLTTNKRPDEARRAYMAAVASDPSLVTARMSIASLDIAEGKFDSARQALTTLASTPAIQAQVEVMLGMLEEKSGNAAAGIPHYRRALEADPNNVGALNNLAYLLANSTDQLDEALKYAQQAKELDPTSAVVEDTLGWTFYRKGLYESAVIHLKNAAGANGTAMRKYHLAMAYLKAGDQQHGQQTLDEARRLDPSLPEAAAASQLMARPNGAN
jgi:tetratricopeptide (TPR) repeat protein